MLSSQGPPFPLTPARATGAVVPSQDAGGSRRKLGGQGSPFAGARARKPYPARLKPCPGETAPVIQERQCREMSGKKKSEDRSRKPEVRRQKLEDGRQNTEQNRPLLRGAGSPASQTRRADSVARDTLLQIGYRQKSVGK